MEPDHCDMTGQHADGSSLGGLSVRCPKHRNKFAGGLYFSLVDGQSFTKKQCGSHSQTMKVNAYSVQITDGQIYVSPTPIDQNDLSPKPVASGLAPGWAAWKVQQMEQVTHNSVVIHLVATKCVTMEPEKLGKLWHVSVQSADGTCEREYTPVSTTEQLMSGELQLLVKMYPDGELTGGYLANLKVGDQVAVSEPEPTLDAEVQRLCGERSDDLCCVGGCILGAVQRCSDGIDIWRDRRDTYVTSCKCSTCAGRRLLCGDARLLQAATRHTVSKATRSAGGFIWKRQGVHQLHFHRRGNISRWRL